MLIMSSLLLKNHRSSYFQNARIVPLQFKTHPGCFLATVLKCLVSTFSFSRAIVLEGFRKSLLGCCGTSRETVVWESVYQGTLSSKSWLILIRGMCVTFSEKQTQVLWVQSAPSRKLDGFWSREKKRGDFVLATDQITDPYFSCNSKKKQSRFCFLLSCKPLSLENSGENQKWRDSQTGTTSSAGPLGLL